MQKSRMASTLKSEAGASIIFVLCTLLFVMTIGVSVLVASSAAAGAATDRQIIAKAELYSDSLIRSFNKSLKNDIGKKIAVSVANEGLKGDNILNPTSFLPEEWISKEIKIEKLPEESSYKVTSTISAPPNNASLITSYSFTPEIPKIEPIEGIDGDATIPGNEREPSVLTMSLGAIVRTTVDYGGKTISVNATYICDGIEIHDNAINKSDSDDKFGEWRLVKIEKVE